MNIVNEFSPHEMTFKPNTKESLCRYRAFWEKEIFDHPPIRIRFPLQKVSAEFWQESCEEAQTHFAYWHNHNEQKCRLPDDDLLPAPVFFGPGFMGGVMGLPVIFGKGTSWNEHLLTDYSILQEFETISTDTGNHWIRCLQDQVNYFRVHAQGKFPVGTTLFTGPGEIMGALRGITNIYLDMALQPQQVHKLGNICTKAFIDTTQMSFNIIPPLDGGYVDFYGIWTPGRSCMINNDLSVGVSARHYRDILYPFDCLAAESMDNPWMHIHSSQARLVQEFLKIPRLRAVQVVNDWPAGPSATELIPALQKIQHNHGLLLRKFPPEIVDMFMQELSPQGLFVDTQCENFEDALRYLESWKTRWIFS